MHEVSLVKNIFNLLETAYADSVGNIRTIVLKVGLLSNVQPILMQNAFEAVQQELPHYKLIKLQIEVLPILLHCEKCGKTTTVQYYKFVCTCGHPSKNIVQGYEMEISQVVFENN
jgi:hydrogenase nickel incorporation protein HypA/HybF